MQPLMVFKETHHEIHVLSSMEGYIDMSSSSLRIHVRGLTSIHLGLRNGFPSIHVGHLHIAVAHSHSSLLMVVSCGVPIKNKPLSFCLAIVIHAQGKHLLSMFWNAVLPHWDYTHEKPYVLLLLG